MQSMTNNEYDDEILPDTDHVNENSSFDPVPAGQYTLVVEQSERKKNQKGFPYEVLTCVIVDGDFNGRKIFQNVTLSSDNEKAEEIGLRMVKQLKIAVGRPDARRVSDLWGIPVLATVGIEKGNDQYPDPKNKITRFKPLDGGQPTPARQAPQTVATASAPVSTSGQTAARKGWRGSK